MPRNWRNDGEGWRQGEQLRSGANEMVQLNKQIKTTITKVYHPGDANPEGFEYLNDQSIRVELAPIKDQLSAVYTKALKGWVWALETDPQLSGLINGSDGLEGKYCLLRFNMPNIRQTGMPDLNAYNSYDNEDKKEEPKQEDYLQQKSGVLSVLI